jgi:hypothetical protein
MRTHRLTVLTAVGLVLPLVATPVHAETTQDPITHVNLLAGNATSGLAATSDATVLDRELSTDDAAVVGLAWTTSTDSSPTATIRFHTPDGWDEWADVEVEASGEGSGEGPATSDAMVAVGADRVEVRITGLDDAPLTSADLMLVDPPDGPATTFAPATAAAASEGGLAAAAAPSLISRAQWGASEVLPYAGCEPSYASRLNHFVIHHTAGTNSYLPADSPRILRGIQAYHVAGRGWCDIGYNFLVDKYGQMFQGRRGDPSRLVVGVHASGYNTGGVGISVLGNYSGIAPPEAAVNAIIHIVGWKSYLQGINPMAWSSASGVALPVVIGHRDVAQTACPGSFWNRLAEIATRARALSLDYWPAISSARGTTGPVFRSGAVVTAGVPVPADVQYTIRSNGTVVARLARGVLPGGTLTQPWNGNLAGTDIYLPTGTYDVQMNATSTLGKAMQATTTATLAYPTSFVAVDTPDVLDLPATVEGDSHQLSLADDLGITGTDTARLVLRVCGTEPSTVTVTPVGLTQGAQIDPATVPGGCGLLAVPTGAATAVDVTRSAGSGAVTVDGLGYLSSALPRNTFWDVGAGVMFADDVQWIYAAGITNGQGDGSYRLWWPVTREAMAAFLYRAAGFPTFVPPATPTFGDVPTTHQFYREIEWLAAQGITRGTTLPGGGFGFSPLEAISRQAMAAFLFRMSGDPVPASVPGVGPFPDVRDGAPFEDEIHWMSNTGITLGNGDGTFQPLGTVSRGAMAAFLHRASGLV